MESSNTRTRKLRIFSLKIEICIVLCLMVILISLYTCIFYSHLSPLGKSQGIYMKQFYKDCDRSAFDLEKTIYLLLSSPIPDGEISIDDLRNKSIFLLCSRLGSHLSGPKEKDMIINSLEWILTNKKAHIYISKALLYLSCIDCTQLPAKQVRKMKDILQRIDCKELSTEEKENFDRLWGQLYTLK